MEVTAVVVSPTGAVSAGATVSVGAAGAEVPSALAAVTPSTHRMYTHPSLLIKHLMLCVF